MTVSVIIRSKDEADRLRLTLESLACQSVRPEVVVVDDGSSDHTAEVVAAASVELDIVSLRNPAPTGRSAASNAGAAAASGDVLIFLDGDTIAAPDFVAAHLERHRAAPAVARGETWHLRCTRLFRDPETGTPQDGAADQVARMPEAERLRSIVTRRQIARDFASIAARGQPGVYPGTGPRKLLAIELQALQSHPDCAVLWAAASGSNLSLPRDQFRASGGFDPRLTINEHRELALRLHQAGCRMTATTARSYHLIHRSGWRDPLVDREWEAVFFAAHPVTAVALLAVLWESLGDKPAIPLAARINSLPDLAAAAEQCPLLPSAQAVREAHLRRVMLEPTV